MVSWFSWCFLCLSFVIVVGAIIVLDVLGVVVGGGVIVVIVGVIVVATVVFVVGGVGDPSVVDFTDVDLYEMKFISTTEI